MRKRKTEPATMPDIETMTEQVVLLLDERQQVRQAERKRQMLRGGPCDLCGMGETRHDRGWSRSHGRMICGRCHDWTTDTPTDIQPDLFAAVLVGVATQQRRPWMRGLAEALQLVAWKDSGRTEANTTPWGHLDVSWMRSQFAQLAPGRWKIPPNWSADRVVVW